MKRTLYGVCIHLCTLRSICGYDVRHLMTVHGFMHSGVCRVVKQTPYHMIRSDANKVRFVYPQQQPLGDLYCSMLFSA